LVDQRVPGGKQAEDGGQYTGEGDGGGRGKIRRHRGIDLARHGQELEEELKEWLEKTKARETVRLPAATTKLRKRQRRRASRPMRRRSRMRSAAKWSGPSRPVANGPGKSIRPSSATSTRPLDNRRPGVLTRGTVEARRAHSSLPRPRSQRAKLQQTSAHAA